MKHLNCQFTDPVNLGIEIEDWEFSKMECDFDTLKFIKSDSTDSDFFLSKTINYGDVLVIFFLSIFLIFMIVKTLWNFIFSKD